MPEIYEGLKRNFPSLSDDDAMKAAQTIAQTVPDLPQSQEYIDPGNSNPSPSSLSSMIEPKIEPDVPPKPIDMIRSLADPERFAKASADYEKYTSSSPGSVAAGIMQWFPRLRQFSGRINDSRNRNAKTAQYEMGKSLEAMKMLQGQENFDRKQALRDAEGKRKEIEFKELHPEEANAMDSAMTQAARGLVSNMMTKAGMGKLADVANQMNFNQLKLTSEKFGLGNQFDQEMQNYRARLSADTANRATDARDRATQAKLQQEKDKTGGLVLTPGQKEADKNFAKEYADWNAKGGYASVQTDLQKLKTEVLGKLNPEDSSGNQLSGIVTKTPLAAEIFTPGRKAIQENLASVVQKSLRQVLGGQFAEREGQQLVERAFNPQLSDAENYKRVSALINQIETMAKEKDRASRYFEEHKTLSGYSGKDRVGETKSVNGKTYRKVPGGWEEVE